MASRQQAQEGMIAQNAAALQPQQKQKRTMQDLIKAYTPEFKKALPKLMTPERFTRLVLSAVSANPKLAECTPASFFGGMMTTAQLGLEPNTPLGHVYLIPYWNNRKRVSECQFQIGYKGLIALAYRSGAVSTIRAETVYENDEFSYALGVDDKLHHVPALTDRGEPKAFYAVVKMKDGGYFFGVMSMEDVRKHAQKFSKSYANGPWQTNFEEMAKKTVLKRVLKYAPMATEVMNAVESDGAVRMELSDDMFSVPAEIPAEVIEVSGEGAEDTTDAEADVEAGSEPAASDGGTGHAE